MQTISGKDLIGAFTLDELQEKCGSEITFSACVHKIRDMGGFSFIILRTGRYLIQSTYSADSCSGDFEKLCEGAYVTVSGTVREEKKSIIRIRNNTFVI